jgi:hypothetical protein
MTFRRKGLWFSARVLFRCEAHEDKRKRILFEETIFLLRASHNKEEAALPPQHAQAESVFEVHRLREVLHLINQGVVPEAEVHCAVS